MPGVRQRPLYVEGEVGMPVLFESDKKPDKPISVRKAAVLIPPGTAPDITVPRVDALFWTRLS